VTFETLILRRQGAVLYATIAAPPMTLLGPELVRDLVCVIQQAEEDDESKVLGGGRRICAYEKVGGSDPTECVV
jgi:hypothetical protein